MALNDATSSAPLRVLAVVEWYPPAYKAGGPIRSVYNLIQLLNAQTSHPLEVVCGPRDLGDEEPLAGIVCDTPHDQDGVRVTYASSLSLAWWRAKLRGTADAPAPDVVYLNSLFSVPFALQPLRAARELGIRVVLAPRGMLGAGAMAIKPAKKTLFLTAARLLGWFRHVRWHASTPVERSGFVGLPPQQMFMCEQRGHPSPERVDAVVGRPADLAGPGADSPHQKPALRFGGVAGRGPEGQERAD